MKSYTLLKYFGKILFSFGVFFLFFPSVFSTQILVENVFSDISKDYKYRDELQLLFDRGMIYPDDDGRFNPTQLLDRDEFVGISMEVICKRCIQPHTEFQYIQKYTNTKPYYDIDSKNKYFYCVAEADANNYVKGYDPGYKCEDGTQRDAERPFCTTNQITLEEAIAVILRNSGIFTIDDNQFVLNQIFSGKSYPQLSDDVSPRNSDGTPYTFYGYFQKALDFRLVEYDALGNEKVYTMIDKIDNKIRPKKSITKEEFLRIAYVALKSNSCTEIQDNQIALAIDIWEKSCKPGDTNCILSKLNDPKNTYDFTPDAKGFCEEGIENPNGYIWRFYNLSTGEEFFKYGNFLDNILLPKVGERRVYLTVIDKCGNSAQVYSTIIVEPTEEPPIIIVYPPICVEGKCGEKEIIPPEIICTASTCIPVIPNPICVPGDVCVDITLDPPKTSCPLGMDEESYDWLFTNTVTGEKVTRKGKYINDYSFLSSGRWKVYVTMKDECGKSFEDEVYIDARNPVTNIALNVDIIALPIIGDKNLLVDYDSIVYGGTPPFKYFWEFGDGGEGVGKKPSHIFTQVDVFETKLTVVDVNNLTGSATVLIKVLEGSCEIDSDGDSIIDCDDICLDVPGTVDNAGCPVVEIPCSDSGKCPIGYTCNKSTITENIPGICLPDIPKSQSCLYSPAKSNIFGNASCNSCPCNNFADFLADVRNCDIVFPAITSPDARDIYSRGNTYQIRY